MFIKDAFEPREMVKFINTIAEFWNMTSVYIIYNSRISQQNFMSEVLDELHSKNTYLNRLPQMTVGSKDVEKPLYDIVNISRNALVLTLMHSVYDPVLEATAKALRKRKLCFTIYLLHTFTYDEDHRYLFDKLWKYQLRRPLVIANGRDLLTMDPYPILKIVNVTKDLMWKWFPIVDGIKDFKGYTVNMPVQTDLPATYFYLDKQTQKYKADGLIAWYIRELMTRLNVTLEVYPLNNNETYFLDFRKIFSLHRNGDIEINPNVMTVHAHVENIDFSYPYIATSRCIMVPRRKKITIDFLSFIDWKLCVFLAVVVTFYQILWKLYPRYQSVVKRDYNWLKVPPYYILWLMLGIPVPHLNSLPTLGRLRTFAFLRFLVVFFMIAFNGNYISQIFSTNLTSFLTANYLKGTSSQLKDIIAANIPIVLGKVDAQPFLSYNHVGKKSLEKFIYIPYADVQRYRNRLNSSLSYLIAREEYPIIDEQQRYLDSKRFILSHVCHGPYPRQFPLRADSHFLELFHFFILRIHEAGLYQHQKRNLFQRIKNHGQLDYIRESDEEKCKITFTTLTAMFYVLSVGYASSITAFIFELYGKRIMRYFRESKIWKLRWSLGICNRRENVFISQNGKS
ncbi:uncharacterized protein LOC131803302 [Musca domestica]|uniref:Uncharacterized protein LOC131803302 n=1 Tax=Musca domestica TaxID=7370 RepID=A0A1I8MTR7_MUSDO|nr:uncharacterized protein LOC131803302 [Musca domestica]